MAAPDRWAPWIERYAPMTGATLTVNSTTASAIAGAVVGPFTPHVDTRLQVPLNIDLQCIANGTDGVIVELLVNGAPQSVQTIYVTPTTNERLSICKLYQVDLTGGTAYTLAMQARLVLAGGNFSIFATHTGIGPIVAMPNLHG